MSGPARSQPASQLNRERAARRREGPRAAEGRAQGDAHASLGREFAPRAPRARARALGRACQLPASCARVAVWTALPPLLLLRLLWV